MKRKPKKMRMRCPTCHRDMAISWKGHVVYHLMPDSNKPCASSREKIRLRMRHEG